MPKVIFVENLYPNIDVKDLCNEFGKHGKILSAKIECGKHFISLRKGCICYLDSTSADIAVKEINGTMKLGNPIQVAVVKNEKQEKHSERTEIDESKLFVKNLDPQWDDCDLIRIFQEFGEIDEVHISDTDGKSNGYGFVKFAQPVYAKRAIQEQKNISMNQRNITVEPFIPKELRKQSLECIKDTAIEWNNLHIKNLDKNVTEKDLEKLFQPYGLIVSVYIPMDERGKSKGFGFVCFKEEEDAARALAQMNHCEYRSRCLDINFNQKKEARKQYLQAIKTDPQIREFKGGKEKVLKSNAFFNLKF